MWQDFSTQGDDRCRSGGLGLRTVWHVRADPSYDVCRQTGVYPGFVAVRTLAGTGRLELDTPGAFALEPGTVLLAENQRITRYGCAARRWHFWWFEFTLADPLFLVLHAPVSCPAAPPEGVVLAEIFRRLRRASSAHRSLASAGLAYLIHRWLAAHHEQQPPTPHQPAIERVVDAMHKKTDGAWTVPEMARTAGLSERRFRQVFRQLMGATPKRFYDGVRLELGRHLLLTEATKISTVAERLGFSSPFHFSRAFRAHYGRPPSWLRQPATTGAPHPATPA